MSGFARRIVKGMMRSSGASRPVARRRVCAPPIKSSRSSPPAGVGSRTNSRTEDFSMTMTDVADTSKPGADTDEFRLLHTMIRVRDLDASLQFYTNLLGMKLLRKRDYPGGKFTLAFVGYGDESNNTMIELPTTGAKR